jgi:predicted nucleic acid-binding protein
LKFWDASAVVPLLVPQVASRQMEREFASDPVLNVWCLTSVEVWSAVSRLRRQGHIDSPGMRLARKRLQGFNDRWVEIDDFRAVRIRAQRLLETHPLRAADALQLGAALVLVSDRPERTPFVTLDGRLAEVATQEGFEVVGVIPE